MPPHDCSFSPLFYRVDDGGFAQLTPIQDITFTDSDERYNPDMVLDWDTQTLTITLTSKSVRRLWKRIHAWQNSQRRMNRRLRRKKERTRREALKNPGGL
jgi:hypothetical protein